MLENSHVLIDGQFVSANVERVVLAIKEYDPDLHVEWLPPAARQDGQAAFKVFYQPVGTEPYVLFYVKDESEFDNRVLQRIIANDQRRNPVDRGEYEAWEEAQRLIEHQKYLDEIEQANDIAAHVFRSHLNTYKVSDRLIIKEGIPFNAAPKKD